MATSKQYQRADYVKLCRRIAAKLLAVDADTDRQYYFTGELAWHESAITNIHDFRALQEFVEQPDISDLLLIANLNDQSLSFNEEALLWLFLAAALEAGDLSLNKANAEVNYVDC